MVTRKVSRRYGEDHWNIDRVFDTMTAMIQQVRPIPRTYGETSRHLGLKALTVEWALAEGFSFVAPEVSFPHRRFRVDVAPCRKTPGRKPVSSVSSILTEAVVFECKQVRSDLIRDNKQRALLSKGSRLLKRAVSAWRNCCRFISLTLPTARACFPSSIATACANMITRVIARFWRKSGPPSGGFWKEPSLTGS